MQLAPQQIGIDVLREKYARATESEADDVRRRVAGALAAHEKDPARWAAAFFGAQTAGFIPAGRINSAAGTDLQATMINCFVQPVGDTISGWDGGRPGIYVALQQAAETMRKGGGVGYDFSAIRPRGALVAGTGSRASGPVSYMHVFDRSCETVESAGARRGAQMGMLRVDHPDIRTFVHAKDRAGALENFNISVSASDRFLHAVVDGDDFDLVHRAAPGTEQIAAGAAQREDGLWVYQRIRARDLFEDIMQRTYELGDPGIVFIDTVNRENNLAYAESIEATNPCGEQPLPPYGCCCLGSIDLTKFVRKPFTGQASVDFEGLGRVIAVAVRMLDNVLDLSVWPLPEQEAEARDKRRIGLGFTGLGDALAMLGLRYHSKPARACAGEIAATLRDSAYAASIGLAAEKGPFPRFEPQSYCDAPFIGRLPGALQRTIRKTGIRNSHLLSIAPTGTISLAFADNVSNGIEPIYATRYRRRKRLADGSRRSYRVEDHAARLFHQLFGAGEALPDAFVGAHAIAVKDHVAMLEAVAPYIDSSISKTVNVPPDHPFEDFRDLYLRAWRRGLKGLATFRPNPVRGSVLETESRQRESAASSQAASCRPKGCQ